MKESKQDPARLGLPAGFFPDSPLFRSSRKVWQGLRSKGFDCLFAGGCVRDRMLDLSPKDYDLATNASPEQIEKIFPRTIALGRQFGTVGVIEDEQVVQVTRFRREGPYQDGRRPEWIEPGSPREDAVRRDFTINGLFADPERNELIDYVGGLSDLRAKHLRAIGDPDERFEEDALRLLRAARFANRFDLSVDAETEAAIRRRAASLARISAERIRSELLGILTEGPASDGIRWLDRFELLPVILPEIAAMKGVEQPPEFHPEGDVFVHTLLVLDRMEPKTPLLLLAGLLHDVGKPPTFQRLDRIRFHEHDKIGAEMAEGILRRLAFSNDEIAQIGALVLDHLRFAAIPQMREGRRRQFLRRPDFALHLALHRADCLASHRNLEIALFAQAELARLSAQDLEPPPLLRGSDLLTLGYSPGPVFGEILEAMELEQLEGRLASRDQAVAWVQKKYPKKSSKDGSG